MYATLKLFSVLPILYTVIARNFHGTLYENCFYCYNVQRLKSWLPVCSQPTNLMQQTAFRSHSTKYKCLKNYAPCHALRYIILPEMNLWLYHNTIYCSLDTITVKIRPPFSARSLDLLGDWAFNRERRVFIRIYAHLRPQIEVYTLLYMPILYYFHFNT